MNRGIEKMSKYNSKFVSSYFYKGTQVLKNKRKIKDQNKLQNWENVCSYIRITELAKNPIIGFEIKHLKKIHKYIFQDVYSFAGKFRTENIIKGETKFYLHEAIEENLVILLDKLKSENSLGNLNKVEFIDRISYYLSELNIIHPFREGNGRIIREFIRCLAYYNDYTLDWSQINNEEFIQASITSVHDYRVFIRYIKKCLK